jgi:hypothetical protein
MVTYDVSEVLVSFFSRLGETGRAGAALCGEMEVPTMSIAHKIGLAALVLAPACASGPPEGVRTEVVKAACPLDSVDWPAAEKDFDRARTVELASRLEAAARADEEAYRTDPATRSLGAQLTAIGRDASRGGSTFVSHDLAALALRLRQLDCALLGGALHGEPETASKRYESIIRELVEERKKQG